MHNFHGPYLITRKLSTLNYEIQPLYGNKRQDKRQIVHIQRLKKYTPRDKLDKVMHIDSPHADDQLLGLPTNPLLLNPLTDEEYINPVADELDSVSDSSSTSEDSLDSTPLPKSKSPRFKHRVILPTKPSTVTTRSGRISKPPARFV